MTDVPSGAEAGRVTNTAAGTGRVIEQPDQGRFILEDDGELIGFALYRPQGDDTIVVPHVETLPQYRGHGRAAELMEGLLAILRADGRSIVPLCSFAAAHIADDPRHHDLLARR